MRRIVPELNRVRPKSHSVRMPDNDFKVMILNLFRFRSVGVGLETDLESGKCISERTAPIQSELECHVAWKAMAKNVCM